MSNLRRQFFIVSLNARNRWRWFLYDEGMKPIASGFGTYPTYDACVKSTRQAIGIAQDAAIWDSEHQCWDERAPGVAGEFLSSDMRSEHLKMESSPF